MLHQPIYTCTIPYFAIFSKEELCWKLILRHFFCFLAIFFHFLALFGDYSTSFSSNPNSFFRAYAPCPSSIDLKMLAQFPKLFPDSPLQIYVYYYQGKEALQSHFTQRRSSSLLKAIESFDKCVFAWLKLSSENRISTLDYSMYLQVKEAASLEAIESCLLLAEASSCAKKQALLQEAISRLSLCRLQSDHPTHSSKALYLSLKLHICLEEIEEVQQLLHKMEQALPNTEKFLAKAYFQTAALFFTHGDLCQTLALLQKCREDLLCAEEKISFWMLKSLCLHQQKRYHEAHLFASKVINSPIASTERLRAMCLRALMYEEENKPEQALRQWQFVASKNGCWARLAKNKLKNHYGNSIYH